MFEVRETGNPEAQKTQSVKTHIRRNIQSESIAIKETELLTFQKAKYQALQIHCEFHQTLKEETVPTLYNLSQKTKAE